jgi:hypothetical protein
MKRPGKTRTHKAYTHSLTHKKGSFQEKMEGKMQRGSEFKLKAWEIFVKGKEKADHFQFR